VHASADVALYVLANSVSSFSACHRGRDGEIGTDFESRVNSTISAHFVPGLPTYLSEVPTRLEGPMKAYPRHAHLD